jgi:hypothetical protein
LVTDYKITKEPRARQPRRSRPAVTVSAEQYSLFAAAPVQASEDARHFMRQAELCRRLLSGLHQPKLLELLGQLSEEFEAKAAHAESPRTPDEARHDIAATEVSTVD